MEPCIQFLVISHFGSKTVGNFVYFNADLDFCTVYFYFTRGFKSLVFLVFFFNPHVFSLLHWLDSELRFRKHHIWGWTLFLLPLEPCSKNFKNLIYLSKMVDYLKYLNKHSNILLVLLLQKNFRMFVFSDISINVRLFS